MSIWSTLKRAEESSDVLESVVGYAKQETIDPLKGIIKWLVYGSIAACFVAIGLTLLLISVLRFLQTATGDLFSGSWSITPYAIVFVLSVVVIAVTLSKIKSRVL